MLLQAGTVITMEKTNKPPPNFIKEIILRPFFYVYVMFLFACLLLVSAGKKQGVGENREWGVSPQGCYYPSPEVTGSADIGRKVGLTLGLTYSTSRTFHFIHPLGSFYDQIVDASQLHMQASSIESK